MGEQWSDVFTTLTDFPFLELKALHLGVQEYTAPEGDTHRSTQVFMHCRLTSFVH